MTVESSSPSPEKIGGKVDRVLFGFAVGLIISATIPIALFPEQSSRIIQDSYTLLADKLGIFYQWATIAVVIFLIWIAASRYGNVRLGRDDESPEFSLFSWGAMLFCAGIGAGLMYWATIEWAMYIESPPYGAEPRSVEAIEWAASYGLFHWGFAAWCLYCLPTLAIAVPFYRNNLPTLRLSVSLHGLFPRHDEHHWLSRSVDFLFMIALVGGTGTSLGLATPMISAAMGRLIGVEQSFGLDVAVLFLCVAVFGTSVYMGLDRGIRRLSDINVICVLLLATYVLVAGPTLFILRMGTDSIGFSIQNMVRMITWTDPVTRSGFIEGYTVFYWAWWVAYAPFFGLFVARISRGRTVRGVIVNMMLLGSLGCALPYIVFGNYGLNLELTEQLSVTQIIKDQNPQAAITEIFLTLPLGMLALAAFMVISIIFAATTYDSASYALAAAATRHLEPGQNPARWHRVFWAFGLVALPIALMFIEGGLKVVQSATLVVSLPILVLGVFMSWSLVKSLRDQ